MNKEIMRKKYILCIGVILICFSLCCGCSSFKNLSIKNQESNDILYENEPMFLYMGIFSVMIDLEFKNAHFSEIVDTLSIPCPNILTAFSLEVDKHPFYDAIDKMRTEMMDKLGKDFDFEIKNLHLKMTYSLQSFPNEVEEGTFKIESIFILKESGFTEEEIKDSQWAMEKLEPYFTLERKIDDIPTTQANIEYIVEAWNENNKMAKKIQIEFTESEIKEIGASGVSKVDFKIVDLGS
ncbi:MAG: hypothetical protein PHW62_04025 [Candidatus Ratteibacteria bacterium]|nr:hypothetical protein [Candidatus Ratteibacteria bacterium]